VVSFPGTRSFFFFQVLTWSEAVSKKEGTKISVEGTRFLTPPSGLQCQVCFVWSNRYAWEGRRQTKNHWCILSPFLFYSNRIDNPRPEQLFVPSNIFAASSHHTHDILGYPLNLMQEYFITTVWTLLRPELFQEMFQSPWIVYFMFFIDHCVYWTQQTDWKYWIRISFTPNLWTDS
jgi:hypothetical protein